MNHQIEKMKKEYRVWAINNQGASIDIGVFNTIQDGENESRAKLGKGWIVTIQNNMWGNVVREFKIR